MCRVLAQHSAHCAGALASTLPLMAMSSQIADSQAFAVAIALQQRELQTALDYSLAQQLSGEELPADDLTHVLQLQLQELSMHQCGQRNEDAEHIRCAGATHPCTTAGRSRQLIIHAPSLRVVMLRWSKVPRLLMLPIGPEKARKGPWPCPGPALKPQSVYRPRGA